MGDKPTRPVAFSSGLKPPKPRGLRKLFSNDALPPAETATWMFDVYGWLLSNLGGFEAFRKTPLVLPTDEFFPTTLADDPDDVAFQIFEKIVEHAGLGDWDLAIAPLDTDPDTTEVLGDDVAFGAGAPRTGAISLLEPTDDGLVVRYAPHLTGNPEVFIAAIAYELGRGLLWSFDPYAEHLPGVDKMDGPLLEVVVTFMGFGVFSANAVYNFERFRGLQTEGWNVHALGELSEVEVSYALALFLALKGDGLAAVRAHLHANPRSYVKKAHAVIERDGGGLLDVLRAVGTPRSV